MAIMSLLISFFRKNEIINYFYRMSLISYKFKKLGVFVFCFWKGFLLNILFICCCWTFLLFFGLIFIVFIWVFIFCLRGLRICWAKYLFFHFLLKFYHCYLYRALCVALWQILEKDELYTHCFDTKEEQPTTHLSV